MDANREPILATARDLYGRVSYTHKTHEKDRELWGRWGCVMLWVNIVLSALTTLFAIISAWLKPSWALLATALSATATIAFVVWQSSFDPVGKEAQHRIAAKELLWIREQLLILITDCHITTISQDNLHRCLETITRELTAVYKFAPNTSKKAYALADADFKNGKLTFSDDEIDAMLPANLSKKKP